MTLTSQLRRAARTSADLHAAASGRMVNRVKNRVIGRALARITWRLWR
jgi:hypothetical protein